MSGEEPSALAVTGGNALEQRADGIRHELEDLIAELVRRRRRMFDVPARLRENAVPLAVVAVGVLGLVVTASALVRRARARSRRRAGALSWLLGERPHARLRSHRMRT